MPIMEQEQRKPNCEKCLCRRCFSNKEGTCMNCERCKVNGGANKVWCLMDCNFIGRDELEA